MEKDPCLNIPTSTKIKTKGSKGQSWTTEEDYILKKWVTIHGEINWVTCSSYLPGRNSKQCRERWMNVVNPTIKKKNWTQAEEYMIFKMVMANGPKWNIVYKPLIWRTENSVKNKFYSSLRSFAVLIYRKKYESQDLKVTFSNIPISLSTKELMKYFPVAYESKTRGIDEFLNTRGKAYSDYCNIETLNKFLEDEGFKDSDDEFNKKQNPLNFMEDKPFTNSAAEQEAFNNNIQVKSSSETSETLNNPCPRSVKSLICDLNLLSTVLSKKRVLLEK